MRNRLGHHAWILSCGHRIPFAYPPRNAKEGVEFKTYKCAKDFLAAYGNGALLDDQGFYDPTIPGMRDEFIKFVTTPQFTKESGKVKYNPSKPISWFVVKNVLPLVP